MLKQAKTNPLPRPIIIISSAAFLQTRHANKNSVRNRTQIEIPVGKALRKQTERIKPRFSSTEEFYRSGSFSDAVVERMENEKIPALLALLQDGGLRYLPVAPVRQCIKRGAKGMQRIAEIVLPEPLGPVPNSGTDLRHREAMLDNGDLV